MYVPSFPLLLHLHHSEPRSAPRPPGATRLPESSSTARSWPGGSRAPGRQQVPRAGASGASKAHDSGEGYQQGRGLWHLKLPKSLAIQVAPQRTPLPLRVARSLSPRSRSTALATLRENALSSRDRGRATKATKTPRQVSGELSRSFPVSP